MATWVGHAVCGIAVERAAGGSRGVMAAAAVVANAADYLDIAAGLLLEGDAGAFHRARWSHSPLTAAIGAAAVYLALRLVRVLRRAPGGRASARRRAALAGLILLTHPLADYAVISPAVLIRIPAAAGIEAPAELARAASLQLAAFAVDLVFYGVIAMVALGVYARVRRRPPAAR